MRLGNFRDHVKYDERSFEQALHLSFEASDVQDNLLYFDVRTPMGSVMLTDPTLEVEISLQVSNPHKTNHGVVQYAEEDTHHNQCVLLDCGAFPIQSNCSKIVTSLKNIVLEDHDCDKYLDKWMSLNYNEAIRVACENTGSEANSHNFMKDPVQGGYIDAHNQEWTDAQGNNLRSGIIIPTYTEDPNNLTAGTFSDVPQTRYLERGQMQVSQRPPDTAFMRRVYRGADAISITLMEPLVTGLWKGSIRDTSMYNGQKSPFIAYDSDFQMRFVIKDLSSMFEQYVSDIGINDDLGNKYCPIFEPTIESATLHIQFAKPLIDIPRTVKYTWPRFRCYSVEHSGSGKIEFPVIRVGEIPHALMVSHRVKKHGLWYDKEHIPKIINDSGCYVRELSIRHNLSRDNLNFEGDDRSRALQFYTKKSFPHLPVNSLMYKHNQTIGFSRADLNITESAVRTMEKEGCIEMGIKMTVDNNNTSRLAYDKNVAGDYGPIVRNQEENLFILPSFTIVESDGTPIPDIQVPVLDANGKQSLILDANGDPEIDPNTGLPTGAIEMEDLASTHNLQLFVDPNANKRTIASIAKIPGQQAGGLYGYYYINWDEDVSDLFLERQIIDASDSDDSGATQEYLVRQPGKSIIRWVHGEGIESYIEYWENLADISNYGYASVNTLGLGDRVPDAVYRTLDTQGESTWYLPAAYPSQYSFGRHLQCHDGGNVRLQGVKNGTEDHSIGTMQTLFTEAGVATSQRIDIDLTHSDGGWDNYLMGDTSGRYFYDFLQWALPTATIYSFPHDSPHYFQTDLEIGPIGNAWPVFLTVYQRDQLVIVPPDPVARSPTYETIVTLVHCDRWVKQDTSTMYRREERSAL